MKKAFVLIFILLTLTGCPRKLQAQALRKGWGNTKPPIGTQLRIGYPWSVGLRIAVVFNGLQISVGSAGGNQVINYGTWPVGPVTLGSTTSAGPRLSGPDQVTPTIARKGGGRRVVLSDVSYRVQFDNSNMIPTGGGTTILMGHQKTDTTARAAIGFSTGSTAAAYCNALIRYTGLGTQFYYGGAVETASLVTWVTPSGNADDDDIWAFSTGPRGMEIWKNGVIGASNSADPTRSASTDPFTIGSPSGTDSDLVIRDFFYLWARQLTTTEIAYLSKFPFDVFTPPPNWLSVFAASAAGGNFTTFHGGGK